MALNSVSENTDSSALPAGSINTVWNGPLTGSGTQRRAPFSEARAAHLSTAAPSPAITICPGQL